MLRQAFSTVKRSPTTVGHRLTRVVQAFSTLVRRRTRVVQAFSTVERSFPTADKSLSTAESRINLVVSAHPSVRRRVGQPVAGGCCLLAVGRTQPAPPTLRPAGRAVQIVTPTAGRRYRAGTSRFSNRIRPSASSWASTTASGLISPARMAFDSSFSTCRCITRLSGRAPYCGS